MRALYLLFVATLAFSSCKNSSGPDPVPSIYGQISFGADVVYLNAGGTDAQTGYFTIRNQAFTGTESWLVALTQRVRPASSGTAFLRTNGVGGLQVTHATNGIPDLVTYFGTSSESVKLDYVNGRLRATFTNLTETDETGIPRGTRRITGYITEP